MAALEIIALVEGTPQLRAPGTGDTYSAPRALALTPESLTGTAATSSLAITQTWNTTGTPTALSVAVTDTASNASSLLLDLTVGGVSKFSATKGGNVFLAGGLYFGANSTNVGWALSGANAQLQIYGVQLNVTNSGTVSAQSGGAFAFSSTGQADGTADLFIRRDAANTLALRNSTNAQAFNVYNTYTDASNYERGFVRFVSNAMEVGTEKAGTGTNRLLYLYSQGSLGLVVGNSGNPHSCVGTFRPSANNTYDLGLDSQGWRNAYMRGFVETYEMTAPAAPAANGVRIYAVDNGAGKTQLMALFASGAAQQLAVEP